MYAIIRAGGKQYKVEAGETIRVEKLEKSLGDVFNLPEILMVGGDKTFIGAPLVANAVVTAVVTRQGKAPKIIVFKKKRRQGYRKMQGHRQLFTELFIQSITSPEGVVIKSETKAQVIDPVKTAARKAAVAGKQKETKTAKSSTMTSAPAKKASKKKVAKKAPTGSKKATAKKSSAKTASKAPAKKAAAKKTK